MLHKIDLFHADFNYFIVLRKKTNLCSQFSLYITYFYYLCIEIQHQDVE